MVYKPGDFVLVHGEGFFDKIIQFGQGLRFPKQDAYWNHVALVITPDGDLIEALAAGVKQTHLSKYNNRFKYVAITASDPDREEVALFAKSRLSDGYGWTTIVSTAICLLFGLKFSFGFDSEDICSGLVARSLERTAAIFPRDSRHMTPADLAAYYDNITP